MPVILTLTSAVEDPNTLEKSHSSDTYNDTPSTEVNICPTYRLSFCMSWQETGKKEKCFLRLNTTKRRTRYSSYQVEVDCKIFAWLFLKVEANK